MSTYLGQFTDEHADELAERFDRAGISWHAKRSGRFAQVLFAGDWGTRLFVADEDAQAALTIAREVAPDGVR